MKLLLPSWLYESLWKEARNNNQGVKSYIVDILVAAMKSKGHSND